MGRAFASSGQNIAVVTQLAVRLDRQIKEADKSRAKQDERITRIEGNACKLK